MAFSLTDYIREQNTRMNTNTREEPQSGFSLRDYLTGAQEAAPTTKNYLAALEAINAGRRATLEPLRQQEQQEAREKARKNAYADFLDRQLSVNTPRSGEDILRVLPEPERLGFPAGTKAAQRSPYDTFKEQKVDQFVQEQKDNFRYLDLLASVPLTGDASLPAAQMMTNIWQERSSPIDTAYRLRNAEDIREKREESYQKVSQWAAENPVKASLTSILTSPLSGADFLQQITDSNAVGQGLARESLGVGEATQALRGGAASNLGGVGSFLYQTGMSAVDSLVAGAIGGPVGGGVLLSGGAASSAMRDIKERGGNDKQAVIGGVAAGVFEALFESLSLGQLDALKEAPVDGVKTLLKNLAKTTAVNASEEAATELANILFDSFFMGQLSGFQTMVKGYLAAGFSEAEAKHKAGAAMVGQIGTSALGGALMGAGLGGITSGWNAAANAITNRAEARANAKAAGPVDTSVEGVQKPPVSNMDTNQTAAPAAETAAESMKQAAPAAAETQRDPAGNVSNMDTPSGADLNAARNAGRGIFENQTQRTLPRKIDTQLRELARAANTPIYLIDDADGSNQGWYENGAVYLNANARQDPVITVGRHEITHALQESAPDAYSAYRGAVAKWYSEKGTLEQNIRDIQALYAKRDITLTDEAALDELAAQFSGELLTDEVAVRRMAGTQPGLLDLLLEKLRSFLRRVKARAAMGGEQLHKLESATKLWEAALREARGYSEANLDYSEGDLDGGTDTYHADLQDRLRRGEISEEEYDRALEEYGGRRYSIAGQNAQTADLDALERAKELERQGVANDIIRQETGWFTGADGKWRFEIDDSGMTYRKGGDAAFRRNHPNSTLGREYARLNERVDRGNAVLEDLIDHEALFAAYPELRRTEVRFADLDSGKMGSYDQSKNRITLSSELRNAPEATLLHEIQHSIQSAEGFAGGSNAEYWQNRINAGERFGKNDGAIQSADARYAELFNNAPDALKNKIREINRARLANDMDTMGRLIDDVYSGEYADLYSDIELADFDRRELRQYNEPSSAQDLYKRTAGEIEARDTARRRNLTQEQRRATMPDTGDENTVFAEGGIYSMSAKEQDSVKEQLRSHQDSLLQMDPVASVRSTGRGSMSMSTFRQKITEDLRKTGYRVERQNFGMIEFTEKELNTSLNYLETEAEAAAYQAIPQVLKRGIDISGHDNHKGRGYDTVTFAAPVELNGKRANMAVVVKQTKGNRYKVHRVLTPSGETFILPNMANAERLPPAVSPKFASASGGTERAIDSASTTSVAKNPGGVKKFSVAGEESVGAVSRETLPAKAKNVLASVEKNLRDRIANALSIPYADKHSFLRAAVEEISDEYLKTGTVSQETLDDLFQESYDKGIVLEDDFYRQYKDLKSQLRTIGITISEEDSHDIPDWKDFKKSARNTVRIVKEKGVPVDVVYEQMSSRAPELFPAEITHPADQLQRLVAVSESIQKVEKTLDEYHAGDREAFRAWAKKDFYDSVMDSLQDLKNVRRYAEDKNRPDAVELSTTAEVEQAYRDLDAAKRVKDKAVAKNLLTEDDENQVSRLLKGEISLENLDPSKNNVAGIKAVYEAKREYEYYAKLIRQWNAKRKETLRNEADGFLETANGWKDKKRGLAYSRETMERNVQDIVPDKDLAAAINRHYFEEVHEGAKRANQMKNHYRDRVAALKLSTLETPFMQKSGRVSEAHAVQLIGEAMDNIEVLKKNPGLKYRDGRTLEDWEAIVNDIWAKNPEMDRDKILNAIEVFREMYDELFQQMNEVRIRNGYEPIHYRKGYFPHFQEGDNGGIIGLFGKAMGIRTDVTALPTTINGITHTFKPGIRWFGNALERKGFDTVYDAVRGFDKYIEGAADIVHQTDNIQKLRAFAEQVRYRTSEEGLKKQVDAINAMNIDEEDKKNRIKQLYENGRFSLSHFVVELDEYTNLLANKKSHHDRMQENDFGRACYNVVKGLESRVAANMVAINPASWLTNFIPITQAGALVGQRDLLQGMWQTLQNIKESDGLVDASAFLTNRIGSEALSKTLAQKVSGTLSQPMEWIDQFTAGSIVRARYNQNLRKGLSQEEAMRDADRFAASVMADRSKGAMPTLFSRSNFLTKAFTQFQLEVNNQLSFVFKDIPEEAKKAGIAALTAAFLKFFLGAWLFNEVYEYFIGRRPALDPIEILLDTAGGRMGFEIPNLVEMGAGFLQGETPTFAAEKENPYDVAASFATDVTEQLPFVGGLLGGGRIPISSAWPDIPNLGKALFHEDWSTEKKMQTAAKEIVNPLLYLLPPFGGGQAKKIYEGVSATLKGGSYTVDKDGFPQLQYPLYNDTPGDFAGSLIQSALFGKTTTEEGRNWVEGGFNTHGKRETAAYQALTGTGMSQRDAYAFIQELRGKTNAEKRELLASAAMTAEEKKTLYPYIFGEEQELTDEEGNVLPNDPKSVVYVSSRDDDILAFEQAGMDMDDFLKVLVEYSRINSEGGNASYKATEFSRWVDQQGFDPIQEETVRDCFVYYSQIPAKASRYEGFTEAGLSETISHELSLELGELKPLEGETAVTSLQKWRAIVDYGIPDNERLAALRSVSTDTQADKFDIASKNNIRPKTYVLALEQLPKFDKDADGKYSGKEVEDALDGMRELTEDQRAVLWQLITGRESGKNNPFRVSIGSRIGEALKEAREARKESKED